MTLVAHFVAFLVYWNVLDDGHFDIYCWSCRFVHGRRRDDRRHRRVVRRRRVCRSCSEIDEVLPLGGWWEEWVVAWDCCWALWKQELMR